MGKSPRFSILLPTHNRPDVLELAIKSVLAQSVQDFELLVVGDGCTDNSGKVVQGFGDERIKWFDLPKAPGFGYANRNVALREAQGDLIAFIGHDNLWFHDHLASFERAFKKPSCRFAYSRPLWISDAGIILPTFVNLRLPRALRDFLTVRNLLPATTIVHHRSCFDEVGFWPEDEEKSGDWQLWKRIVGHYGRNALEFIRQPTCLHFRADWRNPNNWAPVPIAFLETLQRHGPMWPNQLDLGLSEDEGSPQSQVWAKLSDDPTRMVARIRAATIFLQDILAHDATENSHFRR